MNRGRRFEKIFNDKQDYRSFVDILKDASEMWKVKIAAYCLMSNHYHLLERVKKQLQFDRELRKRVDGLCRMINKSQEQT